MTKHFSDREGTRPYPNHSNLNNLLIYKRIQDFTYLLPSKIAKITKWNHKINCKSMEGAL